MSETTPIGHNGGPPLEEPAAPAWPRGTCAQCAHWTPPAESLARAYDRFARGISKVRVAEPGGYCHRVRLHRTGGTSCAATVARSSCWNFEAKPPPAEPTRGGGYVTISKGGRIVWKGWSEDLPARYRDPPPATEAEDLVHSAPAPIGHNRPPAKPKSTRAELRAELGRMVDARKLVDGQLEAIAQASRRRAEDLAIAAAGFSFGRHASDWRKRHEAAYQETLADLAARRRPETEALERKRDRQAAGIEAFARRHGFTLDRYDRIEDLQAKPALKRYIPRRLRT